MAKNSRHELYDFVHGCHLVDARGNIKFRATVIYAADSQPTVRAQTDVWCELAGYEDSVVNIFETSSLTSDSHHLKFTPDFQAYDYDRERGALVITGSSPKMGKYRVEIVPLNAIPT